MNLLSPESWAAQQRIEELERFWKHKEMHRIQKRDARVKMREHSLRIVQDNDRQVDKRLLMHGTWNPISERNFQGNDWFLSHDMGGNEGYILQFLGSFIKNQIDKDVLDEIERKTLDEEHFLAYPFPGNESDLSPTFQNSDYDIFYSLAQSPEDIPGNLNMDHRVWETLRMAFHLLERVTILRRFTDKRNPETYLDPLPDGSNLDSQNLRISWVLHRAWIRALHYRSLWIGDQDYGVSQLRHIFAISMALLHRECEQIKLATQLTRPEFQYLIDTSTSLYQALNGMAADVVRETRRMPSDGTYTTEQTIAYNLRRDRLDASYKKHFAGLSQKWQLWAHLLAHADDIEKRLNVDHVEDTMVEKRIVLYDEFYHMSDWMKGIHDVMFPENYTRQNWEEEKIYNLLRRISEVNRFRRNFLLLRDWSKKRPWKQLYYIFDTTIGNYGYLLPAINEFYDDIARIKKSDKPPVYIKESPSNLANVWASLFSVHPIGSTSHPQHLPSVDRLDEFCAICQFPMVATEIITQLHCDHYFHFTCITEAWDLEMVHQVVCPLCRLSGPIWKLHEQCGIRPEVTELWDNAETVGLQTAEEHPDLISEIQSEYWVMENNRLELSRTWGLDATGQPIPPLQRPPRDVVIEMAVQRKRRRERNKIRREMLVASGATIAGLLIP